MFNHKTRPHKGRSTVEHISPGELQLRIQRRRKRRIVAILLCSTITASASYLSWHSMKGKITFTAPVPNEGVLNVADLSWPDGTEIDALLPASAKSDLPCAQGENDCGTTRDTTKIAMETSLDAMALQQLAEMAPGAGNDNGNGPNFFGGWGGGNNGQNGGWGNGPNFPGNPNGGHGAPKFSNGPDQPNWNTFPSPSIPHGPGPKQPKPPAPVCDPNNANDPNCETGNNQETEHYQQVANNSPGQGGQGGEGGQGGGGGGGGGGQGGDDGTGGNPGLANPDGTNPPSCERDCEYPVGDNGPTSVPEPASLALFGAALAGLGLARRRRR